MDCLARRRLALSGGLVLIASSLQYAMAQIVVAAAWHPAYSWSANFISDLGNTACGPFAMHGPQTYICSPRHTLMNASFVADGVLTIAATLLLRRVARARRLATAGVVRPDPRRGESACGRPVGGSADH